MKEYVNLLTELIRLKPLSEDLAAVNRVQDRLCDFLRERGVCCTMETLNGKSILYASNVQGTQPDLLLNAHVDVVPAADESQFTPRIEDDWLYARGAGDCLGNVICMVKVLCEAPPGSRVGAIFTSDEEIGGDTTAYMAEKYRAEKLVCLLDHYDDDNICFAQKGTMNLEITARGKSAHAATPWAGDNAIDKLIDAWAKLRAEWKNPDSGDPWHSSITSTVIRGGTITNQVADLAVLSVNIRCITREEMTSLPQWIEKLTGLEVNVISHRDPVTVKSDGPALDTLKALMQKHFDKEIRFTRINGATDASFFAPHPAPVAIFGIRSFGEHAAEERASLSSLEKYADMLCELAGSL